MNPNQGQDAVAGTKPQQTDHLPHQVHTGTCIRYILNQRNHKKDKALWTLGHDIHYTVNTKLDCQHLET